MSSMRSKTGAVGILFLLLSLFALAIGYPVWSFHQSAQDEITAKQKELALYRALADQKDSLLQQYQTLQQNTSGSRYYLQGDTAALATAEMQRQLKQLAASSKSELVSTQIKEMVATEGAARQAGLRVHMRMDMSALRQIFHTLESGRPMYFLDNLLIDARPARTRVGSKIQEAVELDVKFDMHGFMRGNQP